MIWLLSFSLAVILQEVLSTAVGYFPYYAHACGTFTSPPDSCEESYQASRTVNTAKDCPFCYHMGSGTQWVGSQGVIRAFLAPSCMAGSGDICLWSDMASFFPTRTSSNPMVWHGISTSQTLPGAQLQATSLNRVYELILLPTRIFASSMDQELFSVIAPTLGTFPLPTAYCSYVQNLKSAFFLEDSVMYYISSGRVIRRTWVFDTGMIGVSCLHCSCYSSSVDDSGCGTCKGAFHVFDTELAVVGGAMGGGDFVKVHVMASLDSLSVSFLRARAGTVILEDSVKLWGAVTMSIIPSLQALASYSRAVDPVTPSARYYSLVSISPDVEFVNRPAFPSSYFDMQYVDLLTSFLCEIDDPDSRTFRCPAYDIIHSMPYPLASDTVRYSLYDTDESVILSCPVYVCVDMSMLLITSVEFPRTTRIGMPAQVVGWARASSGDLIPLSSTYVSHLVFENDQELVSYMTLSSCTILIDDTALRCDEKDVYYSVRTLSCPPSYSEIDVFGVWASMEGGVCVPSARTSCFQGGVYVLYPSLLGLISITFMKKSLSGSQILCTYSSSVAPELRDYSDLSTYADSCVLSGECLHMMLHFNFSIRFASYDSPADSCSYLNVPSPLTMASEEIVSNVTSLDVFHSKMSCVNVSAYYGLSWTLYQPSYVPIVETPDEACEACTVESKYMGAPSVCSLSVCREHLWPLSLDEGDLPKWLPFLSENHGNVCSLVTREHLTMVNGIRVSTPLIKNCTFNMSFVSSNYVQVHRMVEYDLPATHDSHITLSFVSECEGAPCNVSAVIEIQQAGIPLGSFKTSPVSQSLVLPARFDMGGFLSYLNCPLMATATNSTVSWFSINVNPMVQASKISDCVFSATFYHNSSGQNSFLLPICFDSLCRFTTNVSVLTQVSVPYMAPTSVGVSTSLVLFWLILLVFICPALVMVCCMIRFYKKAKIAIDFMEVHLKRDQVWAKEQLVRWSSASR